MMKKEEFKSEKSNSIFTVSGENERTFLTVTGEAAKNRKVQEEVEAVRRKNGTCWDLAVWKARMLARKF